MNGIIRSPHGVMAIGHVGASGEDLGCGDYAAAHRQLTLHGISASCSIGFVLGIALIVCLLAWAGAAGPVRPGGSPLTSSALEQLAQASRAAQPARSAGQSVRPGQAPQGIPADAWSRIQRQIQQRSYAASAERGHPHRLVAGNPAQHLALRFDRDGLHFGSAAGSGANTLYLHTRSVAGADTAPVDPQVADGRIEYRHDQYTEWYRNDPQGLEQGWTLNAPGARRGWRTLELAVGGGQIIDRGGKAVGIRSSDGRQRYGYGGLKAWDAGHRELATTMHAAGKGAIDIAVDDRGAQYPITVDPALTVTLAVTLADPPALPQDSFGVSVAVNGDTLVVGANGVGNNFRGAAYIFNRNQGGPGQWGLAITLNDPPAADRDYFGVSVAVDGDTVVVGAGGVNNNQGAAYIYSRNHGGAGTWGQVAHLHPAGSGRDWFGYQVAVDGDTVVVGAAFYNGYGGQGTAYIYSRNLGGADAWGLSAKLSDPAPASTVVKDYFGNSVGVNGDTVVVGANCAFETCQGAVYIYGRNQGGAGLWGLTSTLSDPPASITDDFGWRVSVDGDTVVVAADGSVGDSYLDGSVYIFSRNLGGAGTWGLAATQRSDTVGTRTHDFGYSIAVEGDILVVGAKSIISDSPDLTYVYGRNQGGAGQWGLIAKLRDPAAAAGEVFGGAVAVDGETVVVGAPGTRKLPGTAYIYTLSGGSFVQSASIADPGKSIDRRAAVGDLFGGAVAVDGDTLAVGAPQNGHTRDAPGSVYLMDRNQGGNGQWGQVLQISDPAATNGDGFGQAVAVDGDTLVVGAADSDGGLGAAYVFERNQGGTSAWGLAATLGDPTGPNGGSFGYSVSLFGDILAIGTQSAAYIFERNQGGADAWGQVAILQSGGNLSGAVVAVFGDILAVGAAASGSGGQVSIYRRDLGGAEHWTLQALLSDPAPNNGGYGRAVALHGDTLVVSHPSNAQLNYSGAVYIYERNQGGTMKWGLAATEQDPTGSLTSGFGIALALYGDTLAVGSYGSPSPAIYLYQRNQGGTENWGATQTLNRTAATFGNSLALRLGTLVTGAYTSDHERGAAVVHQLQ